MNMYISISKVEESNWGKKNIDLWKIPKRRVKIFRERYGQWNKNIFARNTVHWIKIPLLHLFSIRIITLKPYNHKHDMSTIKNKNMIWVVAQIPKQLTCTLTKLSTNLHYLPLQRLIRNPSPIFNFSHGDSSESRSNL